MKAFRSAFFVPVLTVLAAAFFISVPTTCGEPTIVDLSKDFKQGKLYNNNKAAQELTSMLRGTDIGRMLVLEHGEIVMEYERNDKDRNARWDIWSGTKPLMSMLIGKLMDDPTKYGWDEQFNLDTTLGEIFLPDEWRERCGWGWCKNNWQPGEQEFKKNITVGQLLTMTSGLKFGIDMTGVDLTSNVIPQAVGKSLFSTLWAPDWDPDLKDKFHYLLATNIHSYVLWKITGGTRGKGDIGKKPLEFLDEEILPHLGMKKSDLKWEANRGGWQTSLSSMYLNARNFAKFIQLHLQRGKSNSTTQVLSPEYVEKATTCSTVRTAGDECYGYMWYVSERGAKLHYARAYGNAGQVGVYSDTTQRTVIIQRSCSFHNIAQLHVCGDGNHVHDFYRKAIDPATDFTAPAVQGPITSVWQPGEPSQQEVFEFTNKTSLSQCTDDSEFVFKFKNKKGKEKIKGGCEFVAMKKKKRCKKRIKGKRVRNECRFTCSKC